MNKAKIAEIFLSYQGEGTYIGSRQLFVRFFGCNLKCDYCDTILTSYKSFSKEMLLSKIMDFEDEYNELVLTGGEPLLYAEFLDQFISSYKTIRKQKIFIETNGILFDEMGGILDKVDIVSMDFKLPSSSPGQQEFWKEHERFLQALNSVEVITKAVITDTTNIDDIIKFANILKSFPGKTSVILQPVTGIGAKIKTPDRETLEIFKAYIMKETDKSVNILGQFHKILQIR